MLLGMTDKSDAVGPRVSQAPVIEKKLRESGEHSDDDLDVDLRVPEGSKTVPEGFGPDMELDMTIESDQ